MLVSRRGRRGAEQAEVGCGVMRFISRRGRRGAENAGAVCGYDMFYFIQGRCAKIFVENLMVTCYIPIYYK